MSNRTPPRLARWLLRRVVPPELLLEVEGDLAESYGRTADERPLAARIRYWREVLSPSLVALRREARTMVLAPGASPHARSGDSIVTTLLRDLRYAFRVLRKSPGFTAIAILSLGLGIGPNTAIFSMVNAVLLEGAQGTQPDKLVDIYNQSSNGRWFFSGEWVAEELRDNTDVFSGVAAWVSMSAAVDEDGTPESVSYELVSGNYFEVLGVDPFRGRFFAPEEDATLGTHPVAVVSHDFWQGRLGGAAVLDSDIRINGRPYTIVGIAPRGFTGKAMPGIQSDMWLPYSMYPHLAPGQNDNGNLGLTARVKDGIPVATAVAAVGGLGQRIDGDRKAAGRQDDFVLGAFPWSAMFIHPDMDGPLLAMVALLMGVVGVVLLVACINLAGFLLARATDRRREIALRLALGAGRGAIVRQLLIEALVLGAAGGVVGLGLGALTVRALEGIETPLSAPLNLVIPLDGTVLLFTAGISLVAALVFGLTPALQASRAPVQQVLRDESTSVAGGRVTLRNALVVGQMALAVVLMVGAGLFLRSLDAATRIDPGFDTGPAVMLNINGQASGYESSREMVEPISRSLRMLETTPGVTGAAAVSRLPLGLGSWVRFYDIPGVAPPAGRDDHRVEYTAVSPGYMSVMDIPVLAGRGFSDQDVADAPPVAVVSRALAERLWPGPGSSPVGRIMVPTNDRDNPVTIVGMVDDVAIWTLSEDPRPYVYLPFEQAPSTFLTLVARGTQPPVRLQMTVHDALRAVDPNLFVPRVSTMAEHLADTTFLPRMAAMLIGSFALLAMALSVIGLYGVVSYGVARRTREMGIRMSLGADKADVIGLVVKGGGTLAAIGVGLGLIVAVAASGLMQRFLIGVAGRDPLTLVGVPLLLLGVALVAAYLPARRASKIDPMEALRSE